MLRRRGRYELLLLRSEGVEERLGALDVEIRQSCAGVAEFYQEMRVASRGEGKAGSLRESERPLVVLLAQAARVECLYCVHLRSLFVAGMGFGPAVIVHVRQVCYAALPAD